MSLPLVSTQPQPYILATAGHVDHGKSTLVRALTGTEPDRLPEEKQRRLTILPGFAELRLSEDAEGERAYRLGIIDVPGHEDFVRNMVAGVGAVDLILLAVAADDGWMPQTEEHLQILTYLGACRGVVALTKADLAHDVSEAVTRVRHRLRDSPLSGAPIVATSSATGSGMATLRAALLDVLRHAPPPRDVGKPRLPIDRVFHVKGAGLVVTGTLAGGSLQRGQHVIVQPLGLVKRIRALQMHHHEAEHATPGSRVAVNLSEPRQRNRRTDSMVQRGHLLTEANAGEAGSTWDVLVWRSQRLFRHAGLSAALKDSATVFVHHGSACLRARLRLIDQGELATGDQGVAQLRLTTAAFAFAGDRFVLRDGSQRRTLAGGVVLDPVAHRRGLHRSERREALACCAAAPPQPAPLLAARLATHHAVQRDSLLVQADLATTEVDAAVRRLVAAGQALEVGGLLVKPEQWRQWCDAARQVIDNVHRRQPQRPGMDLALLRDHLAHQGVPPNVMDAVIAALGEDGFTRTASTIGRTNHQPALPPHLQSAGETVRRRLSGTPLNPPSRHELVAGERHEQALKCLLISGEAVKLSEDIVLSAAAFAQAVETVRSYLRCHGSATVSELKQAIGSTRRITVPLLEKLAHDGLTYRQGDQHLLKSRSPDGSSSIR